MHAECVAWFRKTFPATLGWHTPNGGKRGKAEAAKFRRLGVLPGVPDWIILQTNREPCFIEFKTSKGRVSPGQKDFAEEVEAMGLKFLIVRSFKEFVSICSQLRKEGLI